MVVAMVVLAAITLWVIVTLVMSMLIYVFCWWKHLRPEPEKAA
jgi:hypothetical protein